MRNDIIERDGLTGTDTAYPEGFYLKGFACKVL
ncbi:SAM-dependent methyltransferase [Vibrio cholerae]|nr:SAM-dependent methyltransferase [Vibrio cholerae]